MLDLITHIKDWRHWLKASAAVGRLVGENAPLPGPARWKRQYTNAFILKLQAFPLDRRAACVVDIGANVGLFSRAAELYCPNAKVIAAEPSSRAFAELSAICGPRVIKVQSAVGETAGRAQLLIAEHLASSTLRPVSEEARNIYGSGAAPTGLTEDVAVVTLAGLLEQQQVGKVSMLKIDVEGFEPQVLAGAGDWLGPRIERIMMEVSVGRLALDGSLDLLKSLAARGYVLVNVLDIYRSSLVPGSPVANFDVWLTHQSCLG